MIRYQSLAALTIFAFLGGPADAATLTGKVNFTGKPPKARKIRMNADPNCAKLHKKPLQTEYVIVNSNQTLKNVFVRVKDGLAKKKFEAPKKAVEFDQRGCRYTPHVFGVMVGQELEIINSDATLHNVHAMPKTNKQFNIGMPVKNMRMKRKFDKAELGVKIKCDVHPWMRAWANVVTNPYYAVTGDDGSFEIKDLPAGTYTVETWHEKYGTKEQKVTVADGKKASVDFSYEGKKKKVSKK